MKCLIIAAGHGSRLRSLSDSKPLAMINGAPLIEHVIRRARAGGASDFLVVTGHRAEELDAFLAGLAERIGVPVATVRTPDWDRPNGYSVLSGAERLDGDYLLMMSDHLIAPEIVERLIAHRRPDAALTLAVDRRLDYPLTDLDDATKVRLSADEAIEAIGKKLDRFDAIDTGVFLATPALAGALGRSIAEGGGGSLSEGVQALADERRAYALDIGDAWWIDVDDPKSLRLAERELGEAHVEVRDDAA